MEETFEEIKTFVLYLESGNFEAKVEATNQTEALEKLLVDYPHLRKYNHYFLLENIGVIMEKDA